LSQNDPLVSVIILNYNGRDCLENCANSVLKTQYGNFEIILVDNASTDGSIERARDLFGNNQRLTILRSNLNLGFSGGNNLGFAHSKGVYVVFLNNDTVVDPYWLRALVDVMENEASIGIAQSLIFNIDGETIQNGGWLFSNYLIRKHPLCADYPSTLKLEAVFDVSFVCGAAMIIKREILETMGAFDPKAPFFYDDTLLTLKTRLVGKRAVTVSNSKIRHISGATKVWKIRFTTYHLQKANMLLMFDIYYKKIDLAKALLFNISHIASNLIFNVAKKNTAVIIGNAEALIWGLRNVRLLWENRLNHWSKTTINPDSLKQAFIRVKLPSAFFLFASKLGDHYFTNAIQSYEKTVTRQKP
jgi:GT2 family glycosyltransferase